MVVGSDGRYLSKTAIEIVVQMAAANGHLTEEKPEGLVNEASRQVALADLVIVNKTDLVSREELNKVRTTVRSINGLVEILETQRSRVDLSNVLDLHAFDSLSGISLQKKLESMKTTDAHLDKDIVTVTLEVLGNIKEENLNLFIQNLLWEKNVKDRTGCTMDVIRLKGLVSIQGKSHQEIVQGVHELYDLEETAIEWKEDEKRTNRFIPRHLTEEKPEGLVNEHLGMDIKTTFLIIVSDCTVRKIIQN
ncbi:putative COBW domain-containing protein 7 isoform X2 [Coturnix japonica]|uniref:putative COBW domain-containing protein 7 isoform X2 n=1 Tax=Coturnix japonica TaxID=93934 RepID=UPI0013A5DBEB|nr:putative COBW domain-containing protein 7 isoform X2 [Coturnix japonica]